MKKFFIHFIIIIVVIISLSGCWYKSWFGKRPCDQPNSTWISEDKKISFTTNENGAGTGIIVVDKEEIDIHVGIGPATEIVIVPLEYVSDNYVDERKRVEYWIGRFNQPDKFTATVKETTYFNIGDEITFYRVDDGNSSNPEM